MDVGDLKNFQQSFLIQEENDNIDTPALRKRSASPVPGSSEILQELECEEAGGKAISDIF